MIIEILILLMFFIILYLFINFRTYERKRLSQLLNKKDD